MRIGHWRHRQVLAIPISRLVVLAGAVSIALHQSVASSQPPDEPPGLIAIASKAPSRVTIVGLQKQPGREFNVGYLPHEVAAAGRIVFTSNYGSAHVRSSELTNAPVEADLRTRR